MMWGSGWGAEFARGRPRTSKGLDLLAERFARGRDFPPIFI